MNCGVYQIENTVNGKRYVGSSNQVRRRFYLHKWDLRRGKHHSITLQRAWDKYGEEAFCFKVLLYCSVAMLHFYEQRCLDRMETTDPAKGFNICCDAAAAGKGRVWTEEQKEASSKRMTGRKLTPEAYQTLLGSRKRGEEHPMFGKHHTEESRKKMSDSLQGRTVWNKGKPQHPANSQAKITPEQVLEMRIYAREFGYNRNKLGEKYGVKPDTAYKICTGRLWPNVGGLPCLPI